MKVCLEMQSFYFYNCPLSAGRAFRQQMCDAESKYNKPSCDCLSFVCICKKRSCQIEAGKVQNISQLVKLL